MGRHALRGAISAWLGLILLEAVVRPHGAADSGRFGSFVNDVTGLVNRALSADVAAIPDRRKAGSGATTDTSTPYTTPAGLAGPYTTAPLLPPTAGRLGSTDYAT